MAAVSIAAANQGLEKQNAELLRRLSAVQAERDHLVKERDTATSKLEKLKSAYDRLLEQHTLLQRRVFMAKAERVDSHQL